MVTVGGLAVGQYRGRARATDGASFCGWSEFGGNREAKDFEIVPNWPPAGFADGSLHPHDTRYGSPVGVGFTKDTYLDRKISFSAQVQDLNGDVALQIEIKPEGQPFDGVSSLITGTYTYTNGTSWITVDGLGPGWFRWRARASDENSTSAGVDFGANGGDMDFRTISEDEYYDDADEGGGGGCGMVGLEALLALGLLGFLRRRR